MNRIARLIAEAFAARSDALEARYGAQVLHAGWNPALEQLARAAAPEPPAGAPPDAGPSRGA